jgi:hypothetical protein
MAMLGDPETRPDEDECLIPTSFATEASRREWEDTGAVSWAMSGPPNTGPREVEAAIRDEFRLRHGEVVVTNHSPQAFLIKFQHRHHCSRALQQGFAKRHGIEIHFVKWRSLANCFGVSLLFRVRLCLDGVPRHAWDDDIVERIIGRRCALESIDTDLLHPAETKTIDLWAWTANPSLIPKKVWLTFTNRAKDAKLQSILVTETPPEHWQQGTKHPVIIHLDEIHDYTASTIDDKGNISPGKRRLPKWHLGVVDGEQVPARAFEEFPHHPPPPRRTHKEGPRTRRPDNRSSKGTKGRYNNDHPDFYMGRGKDHEDEDDYDTSGRGGRDDPGRFSRGDHSGAGGYRERDRSPPRRLWAHGNRQGGRQRASSALEQAVVQPAELQVPAKLPQLNVLQVTEEAELQRLFRAHAMALQGAVQRIVDRAGGHHTRETASLLKSLMYDYIDKASALAGGLGLIQAPPEAAMPGNEAWSKWPPQPAPTHQATHATVPVRDVFGRILSTLPPKATVEDNSIAAVEKALARIELSARESPTIQVPQPTSPSHLCNSELSPEQGPSDVALRDQFSTQPSLTPAATTQGDSSGGQQLTSSVVALFSKPTEPLLQQPQHAAAVVPTPACAGPRRRRRQRAFDMSAVRRSARLANARPMSQMQRAQKNLCRKLGLLHDDLEPVENALQDYIAMFNGPLPMDTIAALTEIFNLDTEETNDADDALLRMVGEGVEELRDAAILTAAA